MKKTIKTRLLAGALCCLPVIPVSAMGAMGNLATTYGVLPTDVASAQALSMFNPQVSATYYNPSYLVRDDRGELTGALLHGEHDLRAASTGGNGFQVRSGDTLMNEPTQHTLIGMKTDISSITKFDQPMYLGVVIGVEKYGKEMMAFESSTSQQGQFVTYGREPLFLNIGGAMTLMRGLHIGGSARVTLHADASMETVAQLDGTTSFERIDVSAKPSIRPILSATGELGELFCGYKSNCFLSDFEVALSFRGYSNTKAGVEANAVIPGTINDPGLTLRLTTLDSYQPDILSLGVQYKLLDDDLRVGLTLEQQNWSALEDELQRDTVKDQANLRFDDILIPRLGAEWQFRPGMYVTGGVALVPSPLKSEESLEVNYFDSDKTVIGLGGAMEFEDPYVFAYPVRLEFGYQYQLLEERDFRLTTLDPANPGPGTFYESVAADGEVHVFSGSMTLKF